MGARMKPAEGAMTLAEMKEFAGFSSATQRYIRRSLDIGLDRDDALARWSRDMVEAASIRAQARIYRPPARTPRGSSPTTAALDAVEPFLAPLVTRGRVRPGAGAADQLLGLPVPLRAADRGRGAAVAARRLLRGGGAAASAPGPAPQAAPVDQRSGGDRVGLVEPPAGFFPHWVEKVEQRCVAA